MLHSSRSPAVFGVLFLGLSVPAAAFHGGGHGGGGGGGGHVGGGGGGGGFAGGGFRGGGAGGFRGEAPQGQGAAAFNRTPSFSAPRAMPQNQAAAGNFNRGNTFNNANRAGTFNNVNRAGTVNNVNRTNTFNNVNRMGGGWQNNYMGYHSNWVHGYWNGHNPGGFGWRPNGYGYGGMGYGGLGYGGLGYGGLGLGLGMGMGMGMGWGLSSWMMGPMLNNWGYSNYSNPYYGGGYGGGNGLVAQQAGIYDYSQPIDPQTAQPDQTVSNQAVSTFDSAREAFKAGDYAKALDLVDQAIKVMPNDPTLHEFRAQTFFALARYDEAAVPLYAVLSSGPGWDWTTLISLYNDPEVYTQQLRALEAFCTQNPSSAAAHFVLAYQYLTEEHPEAAVLQLKTVTTLQPKDTLSAQLLQQIGQSQNQAATSPNASAPPLLGGNNPPAESAPAPAGREGKLEGNWIAQPDKDVKITLAFQPDGRFAWTVSKAGKDQSFAGKLSYENGILTLVQDQNNNTMVGNVDFKDANDFSFKVMGAAPNDPGLSFSKA
jgi:tetratricopeptide (TPR) repeat protein